MSLVINHNLMATRTANALNSHYGNLSTSTQRLSTGLRINSAADDAAGLAIRELQRADIAALHQGARNANDAISMIQTADGALGVIDEKLIRMKELAEQAATGTYDSTQRLMIESEYQQMASEITRIANATDFNGIHLLDGTLDGEHDGSKLVQTGSLKIHFGTGNDSAEDYYYINIGESTAQAFGIGNASTWEDGLNRLVDRFDSLYKKKIDSYTGPDEDAVKATYPAAVEDFKKKFLYFTVPSSDPDTDEHIENLLDLFNKEYVPEVHGQFDLVDTNYTMPALDEWDTVEKYKKLPEREKQKLQYAWGHTALQAYADDVPMWGSIQLDDTYPAEAINLRLEVLNELNNKSQDINYAGYTIQTQEDAQIALNAINDAIIKKDNIRAHLGATQNRLENTITNLVTQAENLQAAESRISDVDVGTEMTNFVRNQILTQAAVAMLSQANSLPQMAMQLIGG